MRAMPGTVSAMPSTSRARLGPNGIAGAGPNRSSASARFTRSARPRSASTRFRSSITASVAGHPVTCSPSFRRPRGWTSRARSSSLPIVLASTSSPSARIRGPRSAGAGESACSSSWSEPRRTTSATSGSHVRPRGLAITLAKRPRRGDPAGVPRGLRAERLGQGPVGSRSGGFSEQELASAGLLQRNARSGRSYDRFRRASCSRSPTSRARARFRCTCDARRARA